MSISPTRRALAVAVSVGTLLSVAPLSPLASSVSAERAVVTVSGLSRGASGDAVKSLQQALVSKGVSVGGGVDGVYGPNTEAAVKQFQSQSGLTASGSVDDATAIALGLARSSYLGLGLGAQGDAVRSLQERLKQAGISFAGGVDGIYGPATAGAVERFRSAKGIASTGAIDPVTAAALGGVVNAPAASTSGNGTTPAPSSSALSGLKVGSRGDAVKQLQRTLMNAGFTVVGGADGIFGALTANALRSFQNANGVEASGVVDGATAAALDAVGAGSGGAPHEPAATNPFEGLRYGSLGADVTALQKALIAAGFRPLGGADGVYGRATEASVSKFQAARGLAQTGAVDAKTADALAAKAPASGSSFVGLKAGSLGNSVKALQQKMLDLGITVRGGADGIFGPATANAVKDFQRSQGLGATGAVDDATAAAFADPKSPITNGGGGNTATGGFAAFGEKGDRVIALQSALVKAGIAVRGGVDGDFGGGTSAAVMEFQRLNRLDVTGRVTEATATKLGLTRLPEPAKVDPASVTLEAFPVQGKCYYGDSWMFARGGGRLHLGVDIIGAEGKLLYAAASGTITKVYSDYPGSLAGNGVRITMADGTYFFYAHMAAVADGIEVGSKVKGGQIVGTLGNTGSSGTPHLHFEVHPKGGSAVNPYPLVKAIDGCSRTEPLPQP